MLTAVLSIFSQFNFSNMPQAPSVQVPDRSIMKVNYEHCHKSCSMN